MNRNHKVFTIRVSGKVRVMVQDPEAPGSGELVNSGKTEQTIRTVHVLAETAALGLAWVADSLPGFEATVVETVKLDGVIETHTY